MDKLVDKYPYKKILYLNWHEAAIGHLLLFKCSSLLTKTMSTSTLRMCTSWSPNKELFSKHQHPTIWKKQMMRSPNFLLPKYRSSNLVGLRISTATWFRISRKRQISLKTRVIVLILIWCIARSLGTPA